MSDISLAWKKRVARFVRLRPIKWLMTLGIRLVVPRHRVGVGMVILDDNAGAEYHRSSRVLLLHHVFHPEIPWGIPGGWLSWHEAPAQGALRELKEETGLTAVIITPITVTHDTLPNHIEIIYLARLQSGSLKLSAEISAANWFPVDELPPLFPSAQAAIETAVAYQERSVLVGNRNTEGHGENTEHNGVNEKKGEFCDEDTR